MNDTSHTKGSCVFREALKKTKGMKRHFWAAVVLFTTITLGGFCVLGIILLVGQMVYMPDFLTLFHANSSFFLNPGFYIPTGMLGFFLAYHISQALYEMLVLLPLRMGIRLIPLRRVADKSVHALFIFKFLTWKYICRFIILDILVVLAIAIPVGLGVLFFCLPHVYSFAMGLKVASYIVGVLFYLLALYLAVAYTFVNLIIIDRDVQPWTAMRISRQVISKKWFCIFGTLIFLSIVLTIATLLFLVGLIWAVPFSQNVIAILYRNMLGIEGKDPVSLKEATCPR